MFETRQARTEPALGMRRLRELEDLGHLLGIIVGLKTPGPKRLKKMLTTTSKRNKL